MNFVAAAGIGAVGLGRIRSRLFRNSSFFFSNLLFFNVQRHSDHHTNAQKPFQTLGDVDDAPELPSGYPGVFALMLVPPLWYAVIHPILWHAIEGDETRLNTGHQA